jgi:hypothetical protein
MPRQKNHADGKFLGKIDSLLTSGAAHEALGNGRQEPGAIAAVTVGVKAAAVGEAAQRFQGALHGLVARAGAHLRDEPDATGIMVDNGVEKWCTA